MRGKTRNGESKMKLHDHFSQLHFHNIDISMMDQATKLKNKGNECFKKKKFNAAIDMYTEAIVSEESISIDCCTIQTCLDSQSNRVLLLHEPRLVLFKGTRSDLCPFRLSCSII